MFTNDFNNFSYTYLAERSWLIREAAKMVRFYWKEIVDDCLTRHERSLIPEPTFAFNASMKEWGRWHGGVIRQIELNERLLLNHPWYALMDVLRHETAHMIREYLYPDSEETSHGPLFRAICKRLGANPAASGNYPPLDEQMRPGEETDDDPQVMLLNKIQKLLNLAMRGTSHEAEIALAKARSMMARHGVDEGMLHTKENNFVTIRPGKVQKQRSRVECAMGVLLQDFWGVKAIWNYEPIWNFPEGQPKEGQNLEISGRFDRVQVAAYVYNYLHSRIKQAWSELPVELWGGQRKQRDFALGVLAGFTRALTKQDEQEQTSALLRGDDAALEEYMRARYPRIRTTKRAQCKISRAQYEAGKAVGAQIRLQPGLEPGQERKQTRLLQ